MTDFVLAPEQPYGVTTHSSDGVIVKQMVIPRSGTIVPQHSHAYEHLTVVVVGGLLVDSEGVETRLVGAGTSIVIPAKTKHRLTSLVDNTIAYCIHNASRTGGVEVVEEHCLTGCHAAPGDR